MSEFGEIFKNARERRDISLEEISQATKINVKFLLAIEEERFEVLPEPYIRAFIKTYATTIGIDVQEMLKRYEMIVTEYSSIPPLELQEEPVLSERQYSGFFQDALVFIKENTRIFAYGIGGIVLLTVIGFILCSLPKSRTWMAEEIPPPDTPVIASGFTVTAKAASPLYLMVSIDGGDTLDYNLNADESRDFLGEGNIWFLTSNAGDTELLLEDKPLERIGPEYWTAHLIVNEKGMSNIRTFEAHIPTD